jgi:hypothetical protein
VGFPARIAVDPVTLRDDALISQSRTTGSGDSPGPLFMKWVHHWMGMA